MNTTYPTLATPTTTMSREELVALKGEAGDLHESHELALDRVREEARGRGADHPLHAEVAMHKAAMEQCMTTIREANRVMKLLPKLPR